MASGRPSRRSDLCARLRLPLALGLGAALAPDAAQAADACRIVEVRFQPQGLAAAGGREALSPQIAVWIEDKDGKYVDTLFVTRATGMLGIGNRSGSDKLKSDFRWPYGKRPGVLPVWAHRRGKTYPLVVMGGACSPRCGGDLHNNGANPDDEDTVAYHGSVSSAESYFCSPSGWRTRNIDGVDVVSCASAFYGSKGRFAEGKTSYYPPRGDIDPAQVSGLDSADVKRYAGINDLAAVSGATPPSGKLLDPPVRWSVPSTLADGEYVAHVEVNIEGDWNPPFWDVGLSSPDKYPTWDTGFGKQFLGQPSVVYSVPFRLGDSGRTFRSRDYVGYGDISGKTGTLNPPDMTIRTSGGSGGDRLALLKDEGGDWRVQVALVPCGSGGCVAPPAPAAIELSNRTDTTMTVGMKMPSLPSGDAVTLQVRYREGSPITEESFNQALPAPSPPQTAAGQMATTDLRGLNPKTTYYIAARAVSACGAASPIVTTSTSTEIGNYTTLSGCFIATAAYGSPMMTQLGPLRAIRDRYLLPTPIGQALVASYYAVSPPLAGLLAVPGREPLRRAVRSALDPLVALGRALAPR